MRLKHFNYARFRQEFVAKKAAMEGLSVYQRANTLGDINKRQHYKRTARLVERRQVTGLRWRMSRNWWRHDERMWIGAFARDGVTRSTEYVALDAIYIACVLDGYPRLTAWESQFPLPYVIDGIVEIVDAADDPKTE